ncbi:MAG: hypothetical protein ACJ76Z_04545 [Thermoleophilaceae bacterium]
MTRAAVILAVVVGALALGPRAEAAYRFETAWGSGGSGAGQFNGPLFLAVGPDGSVYAEDHGNDRIETFTPDGAFVTAWGQPGSGPAQFNSPGGVAVAPDRTIYVVDQGNDRVQRFDPGGGLLGQWGTPGSLNGQFDNPVAVAVSAQGTVYVADAGNRRVQIFLADGAFVSSFTSGAGTFTDLEGIAAGPDGSVYVVDAEPDDRIERFDGAGTFLGSWGSPGTGDGQFQAPRGVAAGDPGLFVADGNGRVQRFTATGAFLDALDGPASGDPQFAGPSGIALSPAGKIYVSFNGGNRIARYGQTSETQALPRPTTGETANAEPVRGIVRVRTPGSKRFVLLTSATQIPIGSIVDVRRGTVSLTTASGLTGTQTAVFYGGSFQLLQTISARPVTELRLYGGNFRRACRRIPARAARWRKPKVVRHLWGDGSGRFRTRGRYASGAVRGTQWLTEDRCDGTRVRVRHGAVTVRDFVKRLSLVLKGPDSYFAAAPRR